jgi:hypothetical protein
VAVAGYAGDVVVVEVRVQQVVGRGVALVGAVEPVVVDGAFGDDVLCPAWMVLEVMGLFTGEHTDAKGLVVVAEDVVGDGPEGGVTAKVYQAVATGFEMA